VKGGDEKPIRKKKKGPVQGIEKITRVKGKMFEDKEFAVHQENKGSGTETEREKEKYKRRDEESEYLVRRKKRKKTSPSGARLLKINLRGFKHLGVQFQQSKKKGLREMVSKVKRGATSPIFQNEKGPGSSPRTKKG